MRQTDVGDAEIAFAQKLASGEPLIRRRALARLRKWISERVRANQLFTEDDFVKLWKGLYYCLWMQDKPLLQEELSHNIADILSCFSSKTQQGILFMQVCLQTIAREWLAIDRWRLDKYLLFVRKFLRYYFQWMRDTLLWDSDVVEESLRVWKEECGLMSAGALSNDNTCPEGFKMHWASLYLDELDLSGAAVLSGQQVMHFLGPYLEMLSSNRCSDLLFNCVVSEVFEAILLQRSAELHPVEEISGDNTSTDKPSLKFDYNAFADALLDIGKKSTTANPARRKVLYALVSKFRKCAAGEDPCEELISSGSEIELSDAEIDIAAQKILQRGFRNQRPKKRRRDSRKHADVATKKKREGTNKTASNVKDKQEESTDCKSLSEFIPIEPKPARQKKRSLVGSEEGKLKKFVKKPPVFAKKAVEKFKQKKTKSLI